LIEKPGAGVAHAKAHMPAYATTTVAATIADYCQTMRHIYPTIPRLQWKCRQRRLLTAIVQLIATYKQNRTVQGASVKLCTEQA
jgi:hypothetical protein